MENGKIDPGAFIRNFEAQFEEMKPGTVKPETEFRQLPGWTSMQALIVIASFDWEYGVTVDAAELREARTIDDLFRLVRNKLN